MTETRCKLLTDPAVKIFAVKGREVKAIIPQKKSEFTESHNRRNRRDTQR